MVNERQEIDLAISKVSPKYGPPQLSPIPACLPAFPAIDENAGPVNVEKINVSRTNVQHFTIRAELWSLVEQTDHIRRL